ncbi:MAG: amidohydrolase family protein [Gemmatimonadetes bacterium]|nr:amidohydrolase family protein [Gemmatimonadota bacterium]
MVVDFHNHFYPPEYLTALRTGPISVRVTVDPAGNPVIHYPGDYNVVVPDHRDIEVRTQSLDRAGIDRQVLTFTTPGTYLEKPDRAAALSRVINDAFAEIGRERGDRFTALATLPLNDPQASRVELERAMKKLDLPGAMLFSNVSGVPLADGRYWPLYETANELNAVLYIHPAHPVGVEAMEEYWLMPLVGFPFDTTLAAAKLVFSGVAERFPRIRWVLAHLGGAIPYLAERLDRGYAAFRECREHISKPPTYYLKQFYYDTVNFDRRALRLALDFAGADHLLAGSDFPHRIGSLESMVNSIRGLDIPEVDKAKILGGNTTRLLGLLV